MEHIEERVVRKRHPLDATVGPVKVRDADAGDLPTIAQLIRALAEYERLADEVTFSEDELGRWLFGERPAAQVLLAVEDDGTVAGMALWYTTFSTFLGRPGIWLEDLFVLPEHRGRGHATALLGALRERTEGRLEWDVLDWNTSAIAFYEGLGARPVTGWQRYRWLPS